MLAYREQMRRYLCCFIPQHVLNVMLQARLFTKARSIITRRSCQQLQCWLELRQRNPAEWQTRHT
jgi:hypothetical protein